MSGRGLPETSIVIRAFNEQRWLPKVLAALANQTSRNHEVLLVDSGSVDRTREVAAGHGIRVLRLRPEDFTFGHSLNAGIDAARGRFIAILSAHAIPAAEDWLERLLASLRQDDTAMVFGGQRGHAVSKFSEARDFERTFAQQPLWLNESHCFANNANSAIRRALWESHPFDEGLPGLEDIEWARYWMQRGMGVRYEPEARVYHIHEESWPQVRRRYHREGIAARCVGIRSFADLPGEIWRETRRCFADLWHAGRVGQLPSLAGEVVRFRYEKTVGTVAGILDDQGISNPARRAEMYFENSYPAVVIRGSGEASLEQRKVPSLKPGEILVRIAYQGVCPTDLAVLDGALGYYEQGIGNYPIVPGHECSGTVVAVGTRVQNVAEGDRVVVECIQGCGNCNECSRDNAIACRERREVGVIGHDGGYAEFFVGRARYAHRVPDDVTLAEAALAEPLAVVLKALRRLGATLPDAGSRRCGIVGAGPIGHLAAQVLALREHHVTLFDRDPARLSLLNGVVQVSTSLDKLDQFGWLIEATGDQAALDAMLERSATGAIILLVGLPYARRSFSFESIVGYDRTVVGSIGSTGQDFEDALETLRTLDTSPFLGATFTLEEFERAWAAVRARQHLKVMLKIDSAGT